MHTNATLVPRTARIPILIADGTGEILKWIAVQSGPERFVLLSADCPRLIVEKAQLLSPRLLLLAAELPCADGLRICAAIRRHPLTQQIPIIIVGQAADDESIAAALEHGADDYLAWPLQPAIALAKIRALLRRTENAADQVQRVIRVHDLMIDGDRGRVFLRDKAIDLTPIPFRLLFALASSPGRVVMCSELSEMLAYSPSVDNGHKLRFHISALRAALGRAGRYIETAQRCGYRMKGESQRGSRRLGSMVVV